MANQPKRTRHSAFDDFPVEENAPDGGAPSVREAPGKIRPPAQETPPPQVERIERLKPGQMMPDRFQPRRLLPAALRESFFNGELDCYQTAERWLALSRQEVSYRAEVERLLNMGESFDEHGQIKPVTGAWVERADNLANGRAAGGYVFQIETGERRFWAACLTRAARQEPEEPLLRVEVISNPTRQRQVLENRHAEPPSAVGQACEIASLILSELKLTPPDNLRDEFDYFRIARDQRMPSGVWEKIMPVMQLTRVRMVQLLNILQLPTPLLELADRCRLTERVLREVLALPKEQWERMIHTSIQNSLTADEVYEASLQNSTPAAGKTPSAPAAKAKKPGYVVAVSGLRRFANIMRRLDSINQAQSFDEIADELVSAGDAESMAGLLDELSTVIKSRLTRRI